MRATIAQKQVQTYDRNYTHLTDKLNSLLIFFDCDREIEIIRITIDKSRSNYGCHVKVYGPPDIILEGNARGDTESQAILVALDNVGITFDRPLGQRDSGNRNYTSIKNLFEAIGLELGVTRGHTIRAGLGIHNV